MKPIRVRTLKINEWTDGANVRAFVELERCCFEDAPWTEEMLTSVVDAAFRHIYVLSNEEFILGYAIVQVIAGEGEVERIGIHPQYRGNSLGKQLLTGILQSQALEECFLEVSATNQVAYGMYQACGFEEIGRRKAYYHDGSDAIMMKWKRTADE